MVRRWLAKEKKTVKGVYTLEMTVIGSLTLFLIVGMVYCSFYWYNRIAMRSLCYTQAFVVEHEKCVNRNWKDTVRHQLIAMDKINSEVQLYKDEVVSRINGTMNIPYWLGKMQMRQTIGIERYHQVRYIRNIRKIQKVLGEDCEDTVQKRFTT